MTADKWEHFLVGWFNTNAAGCARIIADKTHSDTELVLMAFSLQKLAQDLAAQEKKR